MVILPREEFTNKFQLPFDDLSQATELIDTQIGFSTIKKYLNGYASLTKVSINSDYINDENAEKPLNISVSYGKEVDGGVSLSSDDEGKLSDPINLVSKDEYFFNFEKKEFNYKGRTLSGKQVLLNIYKLHSKPTKLYGGLWLRIKIVFWRKITTKFIEKLFNFLVKFLYLIAGIKISSNIWTRVIENNRYREKTAINEQISEQRKIDFFGYKAKAWSLIVYCFVHLSAYFALALLNFRPHLITAIFKNNFLLAIYVISTLTIVEIVLPTLLRGLINRTSLLYQRVLFRKIKI